MKKLRLFFILTAMVLLVTGCGNNTSRPTTGTSENPVTTESEEKAETRVIKSSAVPQDVSEWNAVSSFKGDFDSDGTDETVELVTSAECDKNGDFFWNDGQNWALSIKDGEDYYLLYKAYVNVGFPYFEVSDYYMEDGAVTKINLITSGGAGFSLKSYSYSAEEGGYVEENVYDTETVTDGGINRKYSTFPAYGE